MGCEVRRRAAFGVVKFGDLIAHILISVVALSSGATAERLNDGRDDISSTKEIFAYRQFTRLVTETVISMLLMCAHLFTILPLLHVG